MNKWHAKKSIKCLIHILWIGFKQLKFLVFRTTVVIEKVRRYSHFLKITKQSI